MAALLADRNRAAVNRPCAAWHRGRSRTVFTVLPLTSTPLTKWELSLVLHQLAFGTLLESVEAELSNAVSTTDWKHHSGEWLSCESAPE